MPEKPTPDKSILKKAADAWAKVGAHFVAPPDSEAAGIKAKQDNIDEYKKATQPEQPVEKPAPAPTGKPLPYGSKPGETRIDVKDMVKPLGSFKEGGTVPKTGPYILHKDEKVIPKKDEKEATDNPVEEAVEDKVPEHSSSEKAHFHRAMSHLHKGALHKHLGIPEGEPIPMEKKQEAASSSNPHVAAMGRLALAMHGWGKKK